MAVSRSITENYLATKKNVKNTDWTFINSHLEAKPSIISYALTTKTLNTSESAAAFLPPSRKPLLIGE